MVEVGFMGAVSFLNGTAAVAKENDAKPAG
jgi:hypothetical protein